MIVLRRFFCEDRGASAAEFALVLPLLLLFLLGTIDAGRFAWEFNRAEKATQTGARWAVVTDAIEPGLYAWNAVGTTVNGVTLTQGDVVPAGALGLVTCEVPANGTTVACTCSNTTGLCSYTPGTPNQTAWNAMVGRMQQIWPQIQSSDVVLEYRGSGLGFAGDPNGMDVSPLVTVRLKDMEFFPLSLFLFTGNLSLPDFSYTLPMEDGSGTRSN